MAESASAPAFPGRQTGVVLPGLPSAFVVSWLLCAALTAAFLAKVPVVVLWLIALGILGCGATLMRRNPVQAMAILPTVFLIGPIVRMGSGGALPIHLGDLYLVMITAYFFAARGLTRPIAFGRERVRIGAIAAFVLVSWWWSLDVFASIVAVVGIVQLILAYIITLNIVRDRGDAERVMYGWIGAITLSSILVIVTYVRGETLLLGIDAAFTEEFRVLTRTSTDFLWRATFFVSGVGYPLGTVTLATAALILFPQRSSWLRQFVLLVFLVIELLAMGLMFNKTTLFATTIGAVLMICWAFRSRHGLMRGGLATGVILALLLVGFLLMRQVLTTGQFLLFLSRFGEGESFWARTLVWRGVADFLIESPHALYLGLGPDVSIRRATHPLFLRLFATGGVQQGAVDSGYLYVILNYGIFVLLLGVAIMLTAWRSLTKSLVRQVDWLSLSLWLSIVTWLVMEISQQHGVSKPALMIVHVLAIVHASWERRQPFFTPTS